MRRALALCAALVCATAPAAQEPDQRAETAVRACLECHLLPSGEIDITGLRALDALPFEWPFLFEDAFDLDGDGVAGAMRVVSGPDGPQIAVLGRYLAAARFEDFAAVAGKAHGVDVSDPAVLGAIKQAFYARSPDPKIVPGQEDDLAAFEARGCTACHVTRSFTHDGAQYRPLSDFLLHDLGDGPVRTAPLWGCPECLNAPGHGAHRSQGRWE